MWYFMAGMEQHFRDASVPCEFGLMSFYSLSPKNWNEILEKNNHLLVDSGAYSFQRGKEVNFDEFCQKFKEFIKENTNNPKIVGFFELDIDNIVGYEKVLEYRKELESVSDKIIPVWHGNRGITDYIEMCKKYSGKRVAITALGEDIDISQYNNFINTAHKYGCKIHILGMTHKELLSSLNLAKDDSFDSVGWALQGAFANITLPIRENVTFSLPDSVARVCGITSPNLNKINYLTFRKIQDYYKEIDNSININ